MEKYVSLICRDRIQSISWLQTHHSTSEYLILARLMSSWSAGEHILRPMGSIFFNAATIREVCTE